MKVEVLVNESLAGAAFGEVVGLAVPEGLLMALMATSSFFAIEGSDMALGTGTHPNVLSTYLDIIPPLDIKVDVGSLNCACNAYEGSAEVNGAPPAISAYLCCHEAEDEVDNEDGNDEDDNDTEDFDLDDAY
jgi:hypothetical protein